MGAPACTTLKPLAHTKPGTLLARLSAAAVAFSLTLSLFVPAHRAQAISANVVIGQIHGGGGNTEPDHNSTDFSTAVPSPRNSGEATNATATASATPTATATAVTRMPIATATATAMPSAALTATATVGTATRIREIQGRAHLSPRSGSSVTSMPGIVTARRSNGFYMQDPQPDADPATSEGIFVFTSSAPTVSVGDDVRVSGTVAEFRPGGSGGTANLTITQITSPAILVIGTSVATPTPVSVGSGGQRVPPQQVIDNDSSGSVETSGAFDPEEDGIDFWESLEGMLVQLINPVAVGPTNDFGEIPLVSSGAAGVRTTRGGVVIRPGDFNPERIIVDDAIVGSSGMPRVAVGATFSSPVVGILDYSFGNFKLLATAPLQANASTIQKESTAAPSADQVAIATFNVENLDPDDPQSKFDMLAALIVGNLNAPDLIVLEEVQDNNGATNDSTVDATATLTKLRDAVVSAGGPVYYWRQINPVDDQDGGEPGGNIRIVFFFRTDRGLVFIDRSLASGDSATTPVTVVSGTSGPRLSHSPGRVDPQNSAWESTRKPLAGEFTFHGARLFVVGNHWSSKGGDQPLFGRYQPPMLSSEAKRVHQAQSVKGFVDQLLSRDTNARIVVLGDLNDFEFSPPVNTLEGDPGSPSLYTLIETLPQEERYSYVFEGNSQALDHILVSRSLFHLPRDYDIVHVNSEFFDQASDHDPQLVKLNPGRRQHRRLDWNGHEARPTIARRGQREQTQMVLDAVGGVAGVAAERILARTIPQAKLTIDALLAGTTANDVAARLHDGQPRIRTTQSGDTLTVNPHNLEPGEAEQIVGCLRQILQAAARQPALAR